ncbi:mechanosensitive ion channel protein MscS [Methanoculleus sediminis]|uniref:Mechanosensitive ion channel protein MscS n=1 Tax=Methanoculleus sediminis TaxID=1550566 RepID=A0A0H1R0C3_9EURY|nr:mechanosensitive ion channel family protein [Methanoculleus sediminis]KLK88514.1 mechanosensitive ion channel protein MscS [Methanoculleus sediminis]
MEIAEILNFTVPLSDITLESVVLAVLVAIIGWIVVKVLTSVFTKMLSRASNLPGLVIEFLIRFFSVLLYVILALVVLATLGFDVSSVVLGLSAVIGLILGFGLQDTVTNLAAGVWLAAFRPIDRGEFVEVNGISGTVTSVGIMATELLKPDNTYITIPNALVWGSPVINSTRMETRRVEVRVAVAYDSDLNKAIRVATDLMTAHAGVLSSPEPVVIVTELADSSVILALRAWAKTSDFWGVQWDLNRDVVGAFRGAGIEIAFPQVDVHLGRVR